ncbi:MAG: hypothetical protein KDB27_36545 [Planctomycetales bacterium]|nr:hypothetical protein [Planctomycetales bacterium]
MDQTPEFEGTVNVYCPGCRTTSSFDGRHLGEFAPCPQCGLSIGIEPSDETTVDVEKTPYEFACDKQQESNRRFRESKDLMRVEFRVFRLQMLTTWEGLCQQAADFANSLPPDSLINISHSSGQGIGSTAVTIWYWTRVSRDDWDR